MQNRITKIYAIYENDQLVYVGRTTLRLSQRKANHVQAAGRNWSSPLWEAIRRLGRDAFRIQLIEEVAADACPNQREQHYIRTLNPKYNVFGGRHPRKPHSPETIARMCVAQRARWANKKS